MKKQKAVLFSNSTRPTTLETPIAKLRTAKSKLRIEHLIKIDALTTNQQKVFDLFNKTDQHLFLNGYAGSGKTFISLYLALRSILSERRYDKIVVVRSTVPTRDIGFLPGTQEEKEQIYKMPYEEIFNDLLSKEIPTPLEKLEEQKLFEFKSTSFLRGTTLRNAVVIFDEVQNSNIQEFLTVATRLGENSRLIICGDGRQDDLNVAGTNKKDVSAFNDICKITRRMNEFTTVTFQQEDIVRSAFVKSLIISATELGIM